MRVHISKNSVIIPFNPHNDVMGQSSSQLASQQTAPQMANFYHICNIIPDTPEHHHRIWSPATTSPPQSSHVHNPPPHKKRTQSLHASSSHTHGSDESSHDDMVSNYTTDDESDNYRSRVRRVRRQRRRRAGTNSAPLPSAPNQTHLPDFLDRRYDLDIAPSMVNMDLRFNGAHMVVSMLYNIFVCKFGYHHMLSIQMLFWLAVHKYYQIHNIDTTANYKLSLCTLLDVVKELSLCSERELSIYTNVAEKHLTETQAAHAPTSERPTDNTTVPLTSIAPQHVYSSPFYRMQHYSVPKDDDTMKLVLMRDHLILANLTLFSNFLSSRGGVVRFPNSTDQSAGMIIVTIVGYQEDVWIVKFPFGLHWGDNGFGYVPFDYFERYNRDRWMIEVDECGEPPDYLEQRKKDQLSDNSGLLSAHMEGSIPPTHTQPPAHATSCNVADHQKMRRRVF